MSQIILNDHKWPRTLHVNEEHLGAELERRQAISTSYCDETYKYRSRIRSGTQGLRQVFRNFVKSTSSYKQTHFVFFISCALYNQREDMFLAYMHGRSETLERQLIIKIDRYSQFGYVRAIPLLTWILRRSALRLQVPALRSCYVPSRPVVLSKIIRAWHSADTYHEKRQHSVGKNLAYRQVQVSWFWTQSMFRVPWIC